MTSAMTRAMVAAHRGVAAGAAENTIAAFTNAIDVGADMIEFDVRRTRDGELIAFHDAHVGTAPVGSLTRDEIAAATGTKPPRLAEVLAACAGRIRLDVELKEDGYVPDVMAVLAAGFDPGQMVVTSFLPAVVAQAKDAFPEVKTGLLVGQSRSWLQLPERLRELYPVRLARAVRADYLAPHYKLAPFGVVRRAAAAGLPCLLWTVNDPQLIRKYVADPRVAAVITDEAALAVAIARGTPADAGASLSNGTRQGILVRMRAVVMERIRGPLHVREVPDPVPAAGGVVVEVRATGLCHSDWHAWAGHDDITLPHVPGHELAGTITAIGAGVTKWSPGDRVTMPFAAGCGECEWCLAGDTQVCPYQQQPGFTHWGSFAEYVALPAADTNLVAIPQTVSFEAAASLGCRFATAYRALTGRARLAAGEWLTVVGAGCVGLSAVMIAKFLGARVIAVDRNDGALSAATALGADHVILAGSGDASGIPYRVHEITGGGSHVTIDAVGSEETCADAILSLRRHGRHVQVGLLPPEAYAGRQPRVPMARAIGWELDLLGTHGMAAADYPAMLAVVERGDLRPQDLIEHVIGLDDAAAALPGFDQASLAGMTIIDPRSAHRLS